MTAVKWNRTTRKVREHIDFTLLTDWLTLCPPVAQCQMQCKHLYSAVVCGFPGSPGVVCGVICGGLWWSVVVCGFQAYRYSEAPGRYTAATCLGWL